MFLKELKLVLAGRSFIQTGFAALPGNPLEEKLSAEGTWRDKVVAQLGTLRKLDGLY